MRRVSDTGMSGARRGTLGAAPAEDDDRRLEQAIGREVRVFRHRLGMTLRDVTRVTGLSTPMLSKIENGQTAPSLGTLESLARAFEIDSFRE